VRRECADDFLLRGKQPLLSHLDIELTERCNNDCIHCTINLPLKDDEARNKELSTEEIKSVLLQTAGLGCLSVRMTGGEPLIRNDFSELYLFTRKIGMKVILFTNATLITPEMADLFAKFPLLENIEISLYGMSKASYEAVSRKAGAFESAQRGIALLLERNIPFEIKGVLLPQTKHEIGDIEVFARAIPWMDHPPVLSIFLDLRCRRDSDTKNRLIIGLRNSPEDCLNYLTRDKKAYIEEKKAFFRQFSRIPGQGLFPCMPGVESACVDAYGQLQLCMMLKHPDTLYNLNIGTLKEGILHFFPQIREMKARNPEYLRRCARCFLYGLCEQCPAQSWMEHGTLDTPVEYHCEVAHEQARFLGLIGRAEMAWDVRDWKERIRKFAGEYPKQDQAKCNREKIIKEE
ncbi:MAG: radical SAM protein, partial [Candidatus Aminicenantes bacterium]|nr:radical SAM protein [Candidatus Aminicenantes bacterium]